MVSSPPVPESCQAIGASLTGLIVIVTDSAGEVNTPSDTWNVKLSDPL